MASLILGICGIVLCLGPLAGIPAVICGHRAISIIKRSGGTLTGEGLAGAGLVTGYLSIGLIVIVGLLAATAIPNLVQSRTKAQYNACQGNLKVIQGGKEMWALENKKAKDAVPTDADLFGPSQQISDKPSCPAGGKYRLNAVQESPICSVHGSITER